MPDNGLKKTLAAMDRAKRAPREKLAPVLIKSAEEIAMLQRRLAETSRDTGALIESITVTAPGEATPAYSQPGGSRVAGEAEAIITVGNTDVRYGHLVEYGTSDTEAQPFFWPGYRMLRQRIKSRLNRAVKKIVREAYNQ